MHSICTAGVRILLQLPPVLIEDSPHWTTGRMKRLLPKPFLDELCLITRDSGAVPAMVWVCITQLGLTAAGDISKTLCVTTAAVMEAMNTLANRAESSPGYMNSKDVNRNHVSGPAQVLEFDSGVDSVLDPEPFSLEGGSSKPTPEEEKKEQRRKIHGQARAFIQATYLDRVGLTCPWDGKTAIRMDRWLLGHAWDLETIKTCVLNRFDSDSEVPSQEPAAWIQRLDKFADGPLDKYGKSKGKGNDQQASNRAALVRGLGLASASGVDPGRNGKSVQRKADPAGSDVVEGESRLVPYPRH